MFQYVDIASKLLLFCSCCYACTWNGNRATSRVISCLCSLCIIGFCACQQQSRTARHVLTAASETHRHVLQIAKRHSVHCGHPYWFAELWG